MTIEPGRRPRPEKSRFNFTCIGEEACSISSRKSTWEKIPNTVIQPSPTSPTTSLDKRISLCNQLGNNQPLHQVRISDEKTTFKKRKRRRLQPTTIFEKDDKKKKKTPSNTSSKSKTTLVQHNEKNFKKRKELFDSTQFL